MDVREFDGPLETEALELRELAAVLEFSDVPELRDDADLSELELAAGVLFGLATFVVPC